MDPEATVADVILLGGASRGVHQTSHGVYQLYAGPSQHGARTIILWSEWQLTKEGKIWLEKVAGQTSASFHIQWHDNWEQCFAHRATLLALPETTDVVLSRSLNAFAEILYSEMTTMHGKRWKRYSVKLKDKNDIKS